MSDVSTKQSEEPESMSAQNLVSENLEQEEEEEAEGTGGYRETDVPEERGHGEPGAFSLESENGPSEEENGKETITERERGLDRPDTFKRKACGAQDELTRPTSHASSGGSPSIFLTQKSLPV